MTSCAASSPRRRAHPLPPAPDHDRARLRPDEVQPRDQTLPTPRPGGMPERMAVHRRHAQPPQAPPPPPRRLRRPAAPSAPRMPQSPDPARPNTAVGFPDSLRPSQQRTDARARRAETAPFPRSRSLTLRACSSSFSSASSRSELRFDLNASRNVASTTVRETVGLVRERSSRRREFSALSRFPSVARAPSWILGPSASSRSFATTLQTPVACVW